MSLSSQKMLPAVVVVVITLVVGVMATRNGINYTMDGAWYMTYAESIRSGQGLSAPITAYDSPELTSWIRKWPPLYPMTLALMPDTFGWTRIFTLGLFVITALLTYYLALLVLGNHRWVAAVTALIFVTIPTVTSDGFSAANSETLFTALVIGAVVLMTRYKLRVPNPSLRPALYAAFLVCMSTLTRYLGIGFGIALLVYSLLWALSVAQPRRWLPAIFMILSFIPLVLYSFYLYGLTGRFTGGQSASERVTLREIPESLRQMGIQLTHGLNFLVDLIGIKSNWVVAVLVILLLALAVVQVWKGRGRHGFWRAFDSHDALLTICIVSYLVTFWLLASHSTLIRAELRHYIVIYPLFIVLIAHLFTLANLNRVLVAALVVLYGVSGLMDVQITGSGLYYNRPAWRDGGIIADLPDLIPNGALVHTMDIGYLHLRRPDVPIRTFGGDGAFEDYRCDEIVYPPGYSLAVFTLMDSEMLRTHPAREVEDTFRAWSAPCGTVERITMDNFAMVAVVRLDR
jgi:hypothetical protein